ncbi:MAG: hypothetical protein SPL13_03525 [Clostridia bacterium]|nr:hypothetical protein [Clostridia bacterium]
MLKVRIQGILPEIVEALEIVQRDFNVLNISETYSNRGASVYERVYVDVELIKHSPPETVKRAWIGSKKEGLI